MPKVVKYRAIIVRQKFVVCVFFDNKHYLWLSSSTLWLLYPIHFFELIYPPNVSNSVLLKIFFGYLIDLLIQMWLKFFWIEFSQYSMINDCFRYPWSVFTSQSFFCCSVIKLKPFTLKVNHFFQVSIINFTIYSAY